MVVKGRDPEVMRESIQHAIDRLGPGGCIGQVQWLSRRDIHSLLPERGLACPSVWAALTECSGGLFHACITAMDVPSCMYRGHWPGRPVAPLAALGLGLAHAAGLLVAASQMPGAGKRYAYAVVKADGLAAMRMHREEDGVILGHVRLLETSAGRWAVRAEALNDEGKRIARIERLMLAQVELNDSSLAEG